MNLEKLLGTLMQSGLSSHVLGKHGIGKKKKKHKGGMGGGLAGGLTGGMGSGLGGLAGRAALSKGGLSLLAGIGIAAYEHYRQRQNQSGSPSPWNSPSGSMGSGSATPPPFQRPATPSPFSVDGSNSSPAAPLPDPDLILTAMVAAARADGVLDAEERATLERYLMDSGADAQDWAHLDRLMRQPVDLDTLVARVKDPVTAAEVYGASYLAIDPDTAAERAWLSMLAARLGLDQEAAREIESRLDAAG